MAPSVSGSYNTLLRGVASSLLIEAGYGLHHLQHASSSEIRDIVHHLLVVRPPPDDSVDAKEEEIYEQVDSLLNLELTQRKTIVDASNLSAVMSLSPEALGFEQIALWKGDITTLKATAIVNAANSALLGCFQPSHKCIDNVIHSMAGPRLRAACHEIMSRQAKEEPVGNAQITPECQQLQSCYTKSLDLLLKKVGHTEEHISVAFPCISTGLFAFPEHQEQARKWKVIFNTFLKRDYDLYKDYIESKCPGSVALPPAPVSSSLDEALGAVQDADYLLVAGGAGISAAAGLDYTSETVMKKFHPGIRKILPSFRTMYHSIGYSKWDEPVMWGYLFKQISMVRFDWVRRRSMPTYDYVKTIFNSFESRNSGSAFIKTSNADGMFEQEGFNTKSIYIMQGEYGRIQCSTPCAEDSVWSSRPFMEKALESFNPETYRIEDPAGIPKCPKCGGKMFLLLRVDDSFLQSALEEGRAVYDKWLSGVLDQVRNNGKKLVILEVGAGFNTPGVLRLPNERIAYTDGVQLVRVNTEYPEMPFQSHGVGLAEDANAVLQYISQSIEAQ
ncbi:Phosphatase like proteins to the carbon terminal domain of histone macroH2A1 [Phytophthora megakarya]|uniref:Phosphatase like proteins to the carbon terminal domain of histone macroH2A1 n=1 Tax=Phytophthora megakarya TaxID=4795 RepID=A0A225WBC9_9STRA|nr:Phosphatase like proteins to the carbon terminal domain of histone macroH2A1 [Phytophthora megakarya]